MTYVGNILNIFLVLVVFTWPCLSSDIAYTFQWAWADSSQQISTVLTECQFVKIKLINITNPPPVTAPTPPYYFMAYESGGFSTATFVGTDPANLTWQVKYAGGTQLMLGMADAEGNTGGIPEDLYTVVV
jgi:hypothetical protein